MKKKGEMEATKKREINEMTSVKVFSFLLSLIMNDGGIYHDEVQNEKKNTNKKNFFLKLLLLSVSYNSI